MSIANAEVPIPQTEIPSPSLGEIRSFERRQQSGRRSNDIEEETQLAVARAFVECARTLNAELDLQEVARTLVSCSASLVGSSVSVSLHDANGILTTLAANDDAIRNFSGLQIAQQQGPLWSAYQQGEAIEDLELREVTDWPSIVAIARSNGYSKLWAYPLVADNLTHGILHAAITNAAPLPGLRTELLRFLVQGAAFGLSNRRVHSHSVELGIQLQTALNSRIVIEQAKGAIGASLGISVDEAFICLRSYARSHRDTLQEISAEIVSGSLSTQDLRMSSTS